MATEKTAVPKIPSITFQGRKIQLQLPGGGQVMMWQRVARQFGRLAESDDIGMADYQKALDRLMRMIRSLFADDKDKDWLEDALIDGDVDDQGLLDLFKQIGEKIRAAAPAEPNRAARRVKAKKTATKKG